MAPQAETKERKRSIFIPKARRKTFNVVCRVGTRNSFCLKIAAALDFYRLFCVEAIKRNASVFVVVAVTQYKQTPLERFSKRSRSANMYAHAPSLREDNSPNHEQKRLACENHGMGHFFLHVWYSGASAIRFHPLSLHGDICTTSMSEGGLLGILYLVHDSMARACLLGQMAEMRACG